MVSARGPEGSETGLSGNTEMTGSPLQGKKAEPPTRSDLSCFLGAYGYLTKSFPQNVRHQSYFSRMATITGR